jgi:hypothetical protein
MIILERVLAPLSRSEQRGRVSTPYKFIIFRGIPGTGITGTPYLIPPWGIPGTPYLIPP